MSATTVDREKISEKLLKEWETIDDEALIKEVATKGKYINFLISFLAKRNGKSVLDTKHYFNSEIDKYVNRLLANRQVHKAELVLKNVGREPQPIFYEFVQTTSKEHIDEDIKERVLEHLQRCSKTFDADRDEYDYYLLVLKLAAANKTLRRTFEHEIQVFSLEMLFHKEVEFRKLMAVTTCLYCKNAILVEKLDKRITWNYLWKTEQYHYIAKWLNLCFANKHNELNADASTTKEPCFDVALKNLFSSWDIDEQMIFVAQNASNKPKDFVLNSFAQNGVIFDCEKDSILNILYRIFTTESLAQNEDWLLVDENLSKMIKEIFKNNDLMLLMCKIMSVNAIQQACLNQPALEHEVELCAAFKSASDRSRSTIAHISSAVSKYIINTSDSEFYDKFPYIFLCEQMLKDVDIQLMIASEEADTIFSKIPFVDIFFQRLKAAQSIADYDVTLDDLLKLKNIDLSLIKSEAFPTAPAAVDHSLVEDDLVTFSNQMLSQKYAEAISLNYMDYIKQYRSSYAVYKFLVDQLKNYSQISKAQIQIACGSVCELAINNLGNCELIAHCIGFVEMLGINSQVLRTYLKCLRIIKEDDTTGKLDFNQIHDDEVIGRAEQILLKQTRANNSLFDPHILEPLRVLCRSKNNDLPISFLKRAAAESNWFHFLLFASYHNYSIRSIINVCQMDCFSNRNIGLNIGRALKEIIVDDEMPAPKRTASFSYREHKRKIQSKIDASYLLGVNNKAMSASMNVVSQMPAIKLISSQYLNINDDRDIFAIILISTCELQLTHEPSLSVALLKELMRNPDIPQPSTYLNLIRYAFKLKWPILAVLAATVHDRALDFCWMTWLIISAEIPALPTENISFEELTQTVIMYTVKHNYVRTLHQSFQIFYPESKFTLFTAFLSETSHYKFTDDTTNYLQDYLYEVSDDMVVLNGTVKLPVKEMLLFSISLLIEYLKQSFDSMEHCQLLLDSICVSGVSNYIDFIDFRVIAAINRIICFTSVRINIDELVVIRDDTSIPETDQGDTNLSTSTYQQTNEYMRICEELVAEKAFENAMEIADLLSLPKDTIVYEQWIHTFETQSSFDFDVYDRDIELHSLPPLILVNFLMFVADKMHYNDTKRYAVLKKILDTIKKHHLHPNENFHRDTIECDMIKCALRNTDPIENLEVYNSEYFETIMLEERGVLFKSFLDLKDLSGVDELTILNKDTLNKDELGRLETLMNRLLDQGDIVQALRLQAMFNYRTLDLHYLVFCMALAEGLASLCDLSIEQKQMLNDGLKTAASKFNRRTLRLKRLSTSSSSSSPIPKNYFEPLEYTRVDFEEIPSGEKQDLLDAIQSLASRVNHGFDIAQRIAMVFRSAMYLEKEYLDVLQTKDPFELLHNAINDECLNRLLVMSDVMTSMRMTSCEIADFMAKQIVGTIIKSRFYLFQQSNSHSHSFGQNFLWGYDLDKDFHLFLELCDNTSMLGTCLLKYCDALKVYRKYDSVKHPEPDLRTRQNNEELREMFNNLRDIMENQVLSHKKQNTISVELLIKAHDCFVHECSMEGIAFVLQRCKSLTSTLSAAKSWHLIVKLLTGVGRYRDMYYCFETLMKNDQFESLLGQFEEERAIGLKEAIIAYLHENHPEDKDNYRLAALHFQMFKELAQMSEGEAKMLISKALTQNEIKSDDQISITSSISGISRYSNDAIDSGSPSGTFDTMINGNVSSAITAGVSFLKCNKPLIEILTAAMEAHAHAAENYLLENKLGLAQRAASNAELVALQINLVRVSLDEGKPSCMCVLNIRNENIFRYLVNNELSIPQALILSRAYPYEIVWSEAIFNQYICQNKENYLIEYCVRMELADDMIENLVKTFLQPQFSVTKKMEKAISTIVEMAHSVTLRYKLASLLSDKRIVANLINGECFYYLKDTNYGRSECI